MTRRLLLALCLLLPRLASATCTTTDGISTAICAVNPSHYYRMNDASGAITDNVSGGTNGSGNNAPTYQAAGLAPCCTSNKAMSFLASSSQFVSISSSNQAYFPNSSNGAGWSAGAFIKPTQQSSTTAVISSGGIGNQYSFRLGQANSACQFILFNDVSGTYANLNGGSLCTTSTVRLLVATTTGAGSSQLSAATVYVDRAQGATTGSFSGTFNTSTAGGVSIGDRPDGTGYFDGTIDEVFYVSSALSLSSIQSIYDAAFFLGGSFNPFTVERPQLPRFWNDGYFEKVAARGYAFGMPLAITKLPFIFAPRVPMFAPGNIR